MLLNPRSGLNSASLRLANIAVSSAASFAQLIGGEPSDNVTVRIVNEVRPLPLFDSGAKLMGLTNAAGNLEIEESVTLPTQPSWAASSELGLNPASWIGGWL